MQVYKKKKALYVHSKMIYFLLILEIYDLIHRIWGHFLCWKSKWTRRICCKNQSDTYSCGKPDTREQVHTLNTDCICLSLTHWVLHYTKDSHTFSSCFFFYSYEFKVTPKNELGSGPSSDSVSFSTESGTKRSLESSLLHLLSILLYSAGSLAKALLSKNHKTTLRFYEFTTNTSRQSI